jgi:predicted PolB exonuclease-like 3'-5' exonuclease
VRAQEKELRTEFPQFIINIETQSVSLNGKESDLRPSSDDVAL